MRGVLALCVVLALACAGPGSEKIDRPGFTIELIKGDVGDDADHGNEGDYDVEYGFTTQALSWSPIDPDESLEQSVDLLWKVMSAIIEADGSISAPTKPVYESGTVAGQPSLGFETYLSGATLVSTTWRCPEAGIEVTLNTSGLSSATSQHAASLQTATCKTTPLARSAGFRGYRFVGDPTAWIQTETGPADDSTEWTHTSGEATLNAFPNADLTDDEDLCRTNMTMIVDNIETMTLDPTQSHFRRSERSCTQDFGGVLIDGGAPMRGRLHHEGCDPLGHITLCMVAGDGSLDALCDGVVACP